ncbi:MAG: acyl carrier protein [Clostridia bacterium]|nr:acyl carrier protein [Clostridia bacterium]MBQ7788136.1 acyl carrier protein [Clostridia bacterium]
MLEKILETIAFYAKIDINLLNEDTNILDLDIDSLSVLKIIMDVEHAFGVRFEDEEIVDIRTAKDIEEIVTKKFS